MANTITVCEAFDDLAAILAGFLQSNNAIFIRCDPEITDYRTDYKGKIVLLGQNDGVQLILPRSHFVSFVGILSWWLFGKEKILFTWDVKQIFSYFYHRLARPHLLDVSARIVDIKYGERFLGIEGKCPETFEEAQRRAKPIVKNEQCWKIHRNIHIPLATRVLPKVETAGLRDAVDRSMRYSTYEIEGQKNGRLRCYQAFSGGVLAHNLTADERTRFRPNQDHVFAVLDFKAMEASVLQWLAKDERLGKIISSGRDIYSTIYSLLYGRKCSETGRQFIKDSFLPVVYGMQAESLAARLNISLDDAQTLLTKIHGFFATSMSWVQEQQDKLKQTPTLADYFGREREYPDSHYKARNAVVQGPAAVICLEKLIALHKRLFGMCEIIATVHDAYYLDVPASKIYDVVFHALEVLQSPSEFAPGLVLRVGVNSGNTLDKLMPFNV